MRVTYGIAMLVFAIGPGAAVDFDGSFSTDDRVRLGSEYEVVWQEYLLDLRLAGASGERVRWFSEIGLRSHGFPQVSTSSDLTAADRIAPLDLQVREAYLDVRDLLLGGLDLKLGRQRIAWGCADKVNPTDNINPDDLEDIWNFGDHLSSDALKATYYRGDLSVSGIVVPVFTPALLPSGDLAGMLAEPLSLPSGLVATSMKDTLMLPSAQLSGDCIFALALGGRVLDFDLNLNYFHGFDDLPIARRLVLTPQPTGPADVSVRTEMIFPRIDVLGMDCSGALGNVGVWAEAAVIIPEACTLTTDLADFGLGELDTVLVSDVPFVRWIAGLDYTFPGNVYVNVQVLHGFMHERGNDRLNDYLLLGIEYSSPDERWRVTPLAGALTITDWGDITGSYGVVYAPEIAYKPADNIVLTLGAHLLEGSATTMFGRVCDMDEAVLKAEFNF